MTVTNNDAYLNWLRRKSEEKLDNNKLKLREQTLIAVERQFNEEKRKVFNQLCYLNWYEKKAELLTQQKHKKMLADDEKRQEDSKMQINKRINELKYQDWLTRKQIEASEKKKELDMLKEEKNFENEMKKNEKKIAEMLWLERLDKKAQDEKERQEMLRIKEEELKKEKENRKKLAEENYKLWLKNSTKKPRPVKSNLGFQSLSASNITYRNPVPWKNLLEENPVEEGSDKTLKVLFKKKSNLDVKSSSSTITLEQNENIYSVNKANAVRTADWVRKVSTNVLTSNADSNTTLTHTKIKELVNKFGRNRSAPIFIDQNSVTNK